MTEAVFQFKAIAKRLNCQEQKAEYEEKNPKPVEAAPVVWTPEWGYGTTYTAPSEYCAPAVDCG